MHYDTAAPWKLHARHWDRFHFIESLGLRVVFMVTDAASLYGSIEYFRSIWLYIRSARLKISMWRPCHNKIELFVPNRIAFYAFISRFSENLISTGCEPMEFNGLRRSTTISMVMNLSTIFKACSIQLLNQIQFVLLYWNLPKIGVFITAKGLSLTIFDQHRGLPIFGSQSGLRNLINIGILNALVWCDGHHRGHEPYARQVQTAKIISSSFI